MSIGVVWSNPTQKKKGEIIGIFFSKFVIHIGRQKVKANTLYLDTVTMELSQNFFLEESIGRVRGM